MDTATSDIREVAFASGRNAASPVLPDLPDRTPEGEDNGTVSADGA